MGENSKITWTDDTWNPWIGCTKVSPACDGCYAENLMATRYGRVQWGAPGQGEGTRKRTSAGNWAKPLKWEREQASTVRQWQVAHPDKPYPYSRFVFCASLADVFDNAVPAEWRRDLFDLIRATPHLTWLLLTKRPQNIILLYGQAMLDPPDGGSGYSWPTNAWAGTSIEDQKRLHFNAAALGHAKRSLGIPLTFWSCEPLLEDLGDISTHVAHEHGPRWIITGGETDQGSHKARMMDAEWARSLRDQCSAAGVPFHLKQMTRKGPVPADLQIQERPTIHG
jgi:protein gp37